MDERIRQACRPQGEAGVATLQRMNESHRPLCDWAFGFVDPAPDARCLDAGCGGGAVVARLLKLCPRGTVEGIDYSDVSVKMSREANADAIDAGRCRIQAADVGSLPFDDASFDLVTACETVYFWPDMPAALAQVKRVLEPGGIFLVINEMSDADNPQWASLLASAAEMTVCTAAELRAVIEDAGFAQVDVHRGQGEWLCAVAHR